MLMAQAVPSLQLESSSHAHPQLGLHSTFNHLTQSWECSLVPALGSPLEQLKAGKEPDNNLALLLSELL